MNVVASTTGFWGHIGNFFYSSLFLGLVTFIVGLVVLVVYRKQQLDIKKNAATIILLEIKNAESKLALVKDAILNDDELPETTLGMKSSGWEEYRHLFAKDFADNEWDWINTFYEKCTLYDEAVERSKSYSKEKQSLVKRSLHKALKEYVKEYLLNNLKNSKEADPKKKRDKKDENYQEFQDLLKDFLESYLEEIEEGYSDYLYEKQPFIDANNIILTIRMDLSTTTIGLKFNRIIYQNFRTRFLEKLIGTKIL
jgi:hypothetical protein